MQEFINSKIECYLKNKFYHITYKIEKVKYCVFFKSCQIAFIFFFHITVFILYLL